MRTLGFPLPLILPASALAAAAPFRPISVDTPVPEVVSHPAFAGFGRLVLPIEGGRIPRGTLGECLRDMLPYHNYVDPAAAAAVLNALIAEAAAGRPFHLPLWEASEIAKEPSKEATGLFLLRGRPGAPTAIIAAGGGFAYVGSIHEGLPHALGLARLGFNALVVKYRAGWEDIACEDVAKAVDLAFGRAAELGIGMEGWSVWGSSAGARLAARIGSGDDAGLGLPKRPRPAAVIMAYTGYTGFSIGDPPTLAVVGGDDAIADPRVMSERIRRMRAAGVDAEIRIYEGVRHGFGLGLGTPAEGWLEEAADFWRRRLPPGIA